MLYTSPWSRFELTTSVMIGTDCIGSCKSNYHTITVMTDPKLFIVLLDKVKNTTVILELQVLHTIRVYFFHTSIVWRILAMTLWKESWNFNGQQFNQYQQNKRVHLTLTHWTQKKHDISRWISRSWLGTVRKMLQIVDIIGKYQSCIDLILVIPVYSTILG